MKWYVELWKKHAIFENVFGRSVEGKPPLRRQVAPPELERINAEISAF